MSYNVELFREAGKTLNRMDAKTEKRVRERIKELSMAPLDHRLSSPLVTKSGVRYSRVGNWRIIFTIQELDNVLSIVAIRHRSEAYR